MESRKATVSITSAGGNASKASKKHRVTLPNQWVKEIGITEEDRAIVLSLDEKRIIIEKATE